MRFVFRLATLDFDFFRLAIRLLSELGLIPVLFGLQTLNVARVPPDF